jgi:Recombination endonuclease VII
MTAGIANEEKGQESGGPNRSPDEYMPSSNEQRRKRYAEDPEYRKRRLDSDRRYRAAHKAEINARKRLKRRVADRSKGRRSELRRRYGISLEEYELRLALQNGVCAICNKKPKGLLCVDHCHVTGKVRGLLCKKCNSGLGFCDDDPIRMQAGADYLTAFYESLKRTGDVMTTTDDQTETGKASRLMRKAILLELQCEPGEPDDGTTDNLRLIARRLVAKAAAGDIQAIKEVLDRIDGKPVPGPGDAEQGPRQVSIRWKNAT